MLWTKSSPQTSVKKRRFVDERWWREGPISKMEVETWFQFVFNFGKINSHVPITFKWRCPIRYTCEPNSPIETVMLETLTVYLVSTSTFITWPWLRAYKSWLAPLLNHKPWVQLISFLSLSLQPFSFLMIFLKKYPPPPIYKKITWDSIN